MSEYFIEGREREREREREMNKRIKIIHIAVYYNGFLKKKLDIATWIKLGFWLFVS